MAMENNQGQAWSLSDRNRFGIGLELHMFFAKITPGHFRFIVHRTLIQTSME
ncbi:expressed unknown protein [Ectocarpus siliculosus]|uniref:Uncharacterized protein n=1 Tax=Ectocarpus siliculosus TaxID=2880 RepID=D7FZT1_ECTSI|nr:expressed unknown protein [Ectocarpus siliculosus]|eukprot:CBJ32898.1 expressed unknown protein [Ectocarpus siliculosus]